MTNPAPQRSLRGHRAKRTTTRALNSPDHHAWLAGHLTPRDRWLIRMLFEHKVFTSNQIIDLAFPSRRAANLRLHNLHEWGVVHRFQPHRDLGSHPMHYVLDIVGATILAHEEGIEPSKINYSRDRSLGRAYSLQLAHDVACNSLFTSLVRHARRPDATGRLSAWWSAARCKQLWGDIVVPDGYGRWQQDDHDIEWFLEFDFGTEQLSRLAAKLHRYARLANATSVVTPILFWLPTAKREASARRVLLEALQGIEHPDRVPAATTNASTASDGSDMSAVRWLPVEAGQTAGRVTLPQLLTLWPDLPPPAPLETSITDGARSSLAAPIPQPSPSSGHRRRSAP